MEEVVAWARSLWVVWLGLLFIGIVAYAFWPRRKRRFESHGRIPLEDDEVVRPRDREER
jgi:cytochrome c oxidase cbb3-type subunit IV